MSPNLSGITLATSNLSGRSSLDDASRPGNHIRDFRKASVTVRAGTGLNSMTLPVQPSAFPGFSGSFDDWKRRRVPSSVIDDASSRSTQLPPGCGSLFGIDPQRPPTFNTVVVKGFGGAGVQQHDPPVNRQQQQKYPPASNDTYERAIRNKKYSLASIDIERRGSWDGAAYVKINIMEVRKAEQIRAKGASPDSNAEFISALDLVRSMNFESTSPVFYEDDGELLFAFDPPSKEELKTQLISDINKAEAQGYHSLSVCSVCTRRHVLCSGPPITLQQRDPCGSMLPDWFPRYEFVEPWTAFNHLVNILVYTEEVGRGIRDDPTLVNRWNREYHDKDDPRWAAVGRGKGGWWKCRTGRRAGKILENVPLVEKQCKECHWGDGRRATEELAALVEEQKAQISPLQLRRMKESWMRGKIQARMEIDKCFIAASLQKAT